MKMFQDCMKTTLTTVLEGRSEKIPTEAVSSEPKTESSKPMTERKDEASVAPAKGIPSYNPMPFSHPPMAITKFTGENWTEFIEYFDSLAEANAWSDKDKLAFLLMSIDSKPRMYARGDKGIPQTYDDVRRRLQQRYGQNEPAFNVRAQLREIQRKPGESLEVFADRLQEVAQRGALDPQDRDELFYFAFLNAVRETPKMQNFIEKAHSKNRNLKLSDLLALSQEYLSRSPTAMRRTVAVNVCRATKPVGKLTHEADAPSTAAEEKVTQPPAKLDAWDDEKIREQKTLLLAELEEQLQGRFDYVNREIDWVKKIVKGHKLHYGVGRGNVRDDSSASDRDGRGRFPRTQDARRNDQDNRRYPNNTGYGARRAQPHATGATSTSTE